MEKIKVLVVDDSIVFRELLVKGISTDTDIKVIATAKDPFDAIIKIIEYEPDVLTCDVEMPKMNGIEFVRKLMSRRPIPVIMVSTVSEFVFEAMDAGAFDFLAKPDMRSGNNIKVFIEELILRIKVASTATLSRCESKKIIQKVAAETAFETDKSIIAIGASTGGTEAIYKILKSLPSNMPGIVIAQHIPPVFSRMFAERLNRTSQLRVKEAQTGDFIEKGLVFIAPGDEHMRIKRAGSKYKIECFKGEKVNRHRPSVDVLFESVAMVAGDKAIGIILTGMGYDGAKGLLSMRRKGARTIGQDQSSSVVYGMPRAAFDCGAVEMQAPLESIPRLICSLLSPK